MKTLKPSPDSSVDDTYRIQAAIDEVGNLPLQSFGRDDIQVRGTVLLKKGVYHIRGVLVVDKSGVVLRGEGPDPMGTTLLASRRSQGDFIQINGGLSSNDPRRNAPGPEYCPSMNDYKPTRKAQTRTRKGSCIPVGTATLPVENTRGFKVGDKIVAEWSGSEEWIKDIGMDHAPRNARPNECLPWLPDTIKFSFERTILVVNEDERTFTVDIPMTMNVDPKYRHSAKIFQPAYKFNMISDVGVENLRLSRTGSKEQPSTLHAVQIDNTIHGRRLGGARRKENWVRLSGQMGLMNNCTTVGAFYDFTSIGSSCGPNVFVDSRSINSVHPTGPLKWWVTGSLYDNIAADNYGLENRGLSGAGPGWTGAFDVFYNCKAEKRDSNFESAPGTTNWIIGYQGLLPEDWFERWRTMPLVTRGVFPPSYSTTEWKLPDPNNNTIPNFSRVAYREGHVRILIFPVMITHNPSLNSSVDDTARIQKAIDDVGNLPLQSFGRDGITFRGTVLLTNGSYRVTCWSSTGLELSYEARVRRERRFSP
ncbi:hypothetical protein BGZ75_001583 [Mortierella antarctica]|nr:hypothetical protein BGZ75_001583 [Mortierella antarctica]